MAEEVQYIVMISPQLHRQFRRSCRPHHLQLDGAFRQGSLQNFPNPLDLLFRSGLRIGRRDSYHQQQPDLPLPRGYLSSRVESEDPAANRIELLTEKMPSIVEVFPGPARDAVILEKDLKRRESLASPFRKVEQLLHIALEQQFK